HPMEGLLPPVPGAAARNAVERNGDPSEPVRADEHPHRALDAIHDHRELLGGQPRSPPRAAHGQEARQDQSDAAVIASLIRRFAAPPAWREKEAEAQRPSPATRERVARSAGGGSARLVLEAPRG